MTDPIKNAADPIIARLDRVRELADAATDGPWEAWADQDGKPHMNGLLMVGNAAAVIPEGETWIEGVDINPIAHCYTPEDRRFISAARTDVPMLVDALKAVMEVHAPRDPDDDQCAGCLDIDPGGFIEWPCPTVQAVQDAMRGAQ